MKKIFFIAILFFPFFFINSDDVLTSIHLKAEALTEAHDYQAASQMYAKLLISSLPKWQEERVIYNMGTVQLAQQNPIEALNFFQKITPIDLSLPRFGSYLLLNEGIAYLQYAQSIHLDFISSLDQKIIFIKQSLESFKQAKELECQAQKQENSSFCETSFLLDQWMKTARLQLNQLFQNNCQRWIEHASVETLASLIYKRMQKWQKFQKKSQEISYLYYQAESLTSLWKSLQQKKISTEQKTNFEKSMNFYLIALQKLNEKNESAAIQQWEQSTKALQPLIFQKNQDIQYLLLNYDILFLQNTLSLFSLKDLIKQFEDLHVSEKQANLLKPIQLLLKLSLEAFQNQFVNQAQFFFIASYSQLHALFQSKEPSPAEILKQILNQANRNLQLSFLAEMMPKDKLEQIQAILRDQQHTILSEATLFIPAVLKEQNEHFHQTTNIDSRCQETPWNQAIPLYDQGFQFAQKIDKQYQQEIVDLQPVIVGQIQTIKKWEQALNLILHPPQQKEVAKTDQQWTNTFRQIQEMYLEDQSQPQQTTKELHSW